MLVRLCGTLLAALVGGGAVTVPCTCPPPETETISCTHGVPSFPAATCTVTQQTPRLVLVRLACPPGETAISAGFRHLAGPPRPLLEMSPVVPSGGHATSYRFIWRNLPGGTDLRAYITCQRD
jgi:hypothetical protein